MTLKSVKNTQGEEPRTSILIKFDYSCQYVLPMEEGGAVVAALAKARKLRNDYKDGDYVMSLEDSAGKIDVEYMTEVELKKVILATIINPKGAA
jgi:hypothetical protein